jgi:phosphoribosylformimino-5-aminoimidazole carboxamide ribotide isomerase
MFLIIPAIDLKDGQCVRLVQGDFAQATVYSPDPLDVARHLQQQGAEIIHLVDLDGALAGAPRHRHLIGQIAASLDIPVQVGGGIRDLATVKDYMQMGVRRVIIGTGALRDEELVRKAVAAFPGRIFLGIDTRDKMVAVQGWTEQTKVAAVELVRRYETPGLGGVILTDIRKDGTQTGVDVNAVREFIVQVSCPVIVSGGVASLADIVNLMSIKETGVAGVIVGKALYSGAVDLRLALRLARGGWRDGDVH